VRNNINTYINVVGWDKKVALIGADFGFGEPKKEATDAIRDYVKDDSSTNTNSLVTISWHADNPWDINFTKKIQNMTIK